MATRATGAAAAPEATSIGSLVGAHRLAVTAGHLGEGDFDPRRAPPRRNGWIILGRGMQHLAALAHIDFLLAQAIDAHIPLLRVNLDSRAYVDSFGALNKRIRVAVQEMYKTLPKKDEASKAGILVLVRGVSRMVNRVVFNKKHSQESVRSKLDDIESCLKALRTGTANLPRDDDADAGADADAKPEVFGNQKVEPVVKDEMPEVAKPSAVESQ